ncbi:tetratricopeptide repeat protein [Aliarcobacter cryaerophilus]|uniref:tetratricopeptide repeat protein n=1 Tax=Aliarcobacter cryaerophilus TaxID=28198 RepID=UPI003DA3614D
MSSSDKYSVKKQLENGDKYYIAINPDYEKAFKWYEKATLQEDASSQYWIALLYKLGYGTKIDYTEAFKWLEKSANQGNIHAILLLANNYYFGDGVKQNKMKAKQLYKKACEQGNKDSCKNLKKFNFTN